MRKKISFMVVMLLLFLFVACGGNSGSSTSGDVESSNTLAAVKERGSLLCGVSTGLPGFSVPDSNGNWIGLDVDYCRAVSAAVLGDASKVKYVPLTGKERLTALQSGEIDVLSRNTTWTHTRDTSLGLNFAGVNYYDGQGFLVKKKLGIKSAKELNGASVCIQAGTTTELNLADYFRFNKMSYKAVTFDTSDQTQQGFEQGRCDILTSDRSQLAALRIKLADPSSAVVLTEVISKEPLGPSVRQGDDAWFNVAKWVLYALIEAEEQGINSGNVDSFKGDSTATPNVRRLLGDEGKLGENLGLNNDWAYNIVKQVGNYEESYNRHVGPNSPLGIARGVNSLWSKGGLLYPMPFR